MIDKAMEYCRSILHNVSRSFALTIPMVERTILAPVLVGYLEARILDSFEDESPGKRIPLRRRRQYLQRVLAVIQHPGTATDRDLAAIGRLATRVIAHPHYRDLAANMDKVVAVHRTMDPHAQSAIALWFGEMVAGMQKYLVTTIRTFEQLDDYCYYVGGTVGGMLTDLVLRHSRHAGARQRQLLQGAYRDFGLFLQKVNIIRDFREDLLRGEKVFWPSALFAERCVTPRQLLQRRHQPQAMDILGIMVGNAQRHADAVRRYISAIPGDFPGFRKFALISFLMGIETLKRVRSNPQLFYGRSPVRIRKPVARAILADPFSYAARLSFSP